jgi:hypothetical protein
MTVRARLAVMVATTGAAAPAWADRLGQAPDEGPSLIRVVVAFALCALLALGAALLLRARGGATLPWIRPATDRRLRLVESIRLTPQVQLSIVRCDDREMLMTTSAQGASLVADLPMPGPGTPV